MIDQNLQSRLLDRIQKLLESQRISVKIEDNRIIINNKEYKTSNTQTIKRTNINKFR